MKKLILACAATFAAFNGYGVGATQEWVRRHVVSALESVVRKSSATNIEVTASVPASLFTNGDTNSTYTCTITAGAGTHAALKVVQSSVPEIPAGTFYALDGKGDYVNCSNALISTIYAVPYTSQTLATNALGGVSTNSVRMGNFYAVDSTNGVWRMGIDGDTILYNSGDRAAHIVIRSTTLPERAAAVLIPAQTARLSVRDMLSLVVPTACARENTETIYTVNSETTIAISTITFTRTNRFGKTTEITFTPQGLQGVYSGPNGPFSTKEEAESAVNNLANWDFGDWDSIWNVGGFGRMTRAEFEHSDVWKQLVSAVGTDKKEVLVKVPGAPAHPCPAPDDIFYLDTAATVWKVNAKYAVEGSAGVIDTEKLDAWRGSHECKCAFVGCPNCGISKHRVGRVSFPAGNELYTDDVDGGIGCKCCIRCAKYGDDPDATILLYNDHREAGDGSGSCGCACGMYTEDNADEWPMDFHNRPRHTAVSWRPGDAESPDFSCLCYCSKRDALDGGLVRHAKYSGDSPWCMGICQRCGMVEDEEEWIVPSYLAFPVKYVKLRTPTINDHTPRADADVAVPIVDDPTYYDRCGCACGLYDTAGGDILPAKFASFHQMMNSILTCRCFCGQIHKPNYKGEGQDPAEPWPCPKICAVCKKVKDDESTAKVTLDGETYDKLVMIDPDDEKHHEPHDTECGCKCYNGTYGTGSSAHEWSVGANGIDGLGCEGTDPKFHKVSAGGCACRCGALSHLATGAELLLWKMAHEKWHAECECENVCDVCGRKVFLGAEATREDHTPSDEVCGCRCGEVTALDSGTTTEETKAFHVARDADYSCLCECGRFHDGEWNTKTCGSHSWRQCSLVPEHIHEGDEAVHEYASGYQNDAVHFCKCADRMTAAHATTRTQTGVEPGFRIYTVACSVAGCGFSKTEKDPCAHSWGNWLKISDFPGGTLFRRTCSVCGATEDRLVGYAESLMCDTNINLHIPAVDICGCKCGKYGIGAETADEKDFHKWDATDTEGGVANCHCQCGAKHEWRDGCVCPSVCAYCKELRFDGSRADESDHLPAERSERRCGCKCGYFGVSAAHETSGHVARTERLHIQSMQNNSSSPSSPAYCQCFGPSGSGGRWHFHYARSSSTCPDVCSYVRTGESLGHKASVGDPERGFVPATAEDHRGKTDHVGGCGCKCGLCTAANHADWARNVSLHQYNSSQTNKCQCACGDGVYCGDTMIDGELHTFPIQSNSAVGEFRCTCTCGKKHRWLSGEWVDKGKCGKYCKICKKIFRDGRSYSNIAANHIFDDSKCKCDCGDHVNPDGHYYADESCTCQCGDETIDHIAVQSTPTVLGSAVCSMCGRVFSRQQFTVSCARCGTQLSSGTVNVGSHAEGCGTPTSPQTGCSKCGCSCSGKCSGHYCAACCSSRPTRPKRLTNDPAISNPCNHKNKGHSSETVTDSWTCSICGETLRSKTVLYYCLACGAFDGSTTVTTGTHGDHSGNADPTPGDDDDPPGPPEDECEYCGVLDGEPHEPNCPHYRPTGSGNSGGGNLDDI